MRLQLLARASVAWLLVTLASPPSSPALPQSADPALTTGVRQVDEGDFEGAILTLQPLVERLPSPGGPDAARACLYLGIAQLALDRRDAARLRFRQALENQPSLRLSPDHFSPKVIAAFEAARRERDAARRGAGASSSKGSHKGRTLLIAGAAAVAGGGIALLATRSDSVSVGSVRFTSARFAPAAVDCPDGSVGVPMPVGIDVEATNEDDQQATITSVLSTLIITASSALPEEVGTEKTAATTVTPSSFGRGTTTLHVRTTLGCWNDPDGAARYNVWMGRVTLATASGAATVETIDRLRVNIP